MVRILSWNVNSVRARQDRLLALLRRHAPDVACLQELKCEASQFPADAVREAGYEAVVHAQPTYNGVALLSRLPVEDVRMGLVDEVADDQARLLSARIAGVRVFSVYVPNGDVPQSAKFVYKLRWMERLADKLAREHAPDEPLALCGDFNVAPTDRDVKIPAKWKKTVLCHPDARARLEQVRASLALVDTMRIHHPDTQGPYSFWDYRALSFPKDDGLRIDHIDVTAPLAARCTACVIDRDERKGAQPSDHAPVIADFTG